MSQRAIDFLHSNRQQFLESLLDFLRIKSVSSQRVHHFDCEQCAQFLQDELSAMGMESRIYPTAGLPIVYAEKIQNPNLPTILVYGHYDVQPPEPLELWNNPPFEPLIYDNKIFARGSSDDKGQVFLQLKAFHAMLAVNELPVNVKFLIEGEEEIGSDNLGVFIRKNKQLLQTDLILISDTAMHALDVPSIDVGLRGICAFEIQLNGPNRDLHSGNYGGGILNPILALSRILNQLQDADGRILVPDFYADVLPLSNEFRQLINTLPFDKTKWYNSLGTSEWGEPGYSVLERISLRPTLEVNGIWGGYQGDGSKTIIPASASAKITCRLVANQNPAKTYQLLKDYIKKISPNPVKLTLLEQHGGNAYSMPLDHLAYKAATEAIDKVFGKKPLPKCSGGSIPIVAEFEEVLEVKSLLLGFGLEDDNLHSPNEKFDLAMFYKGMDTVVEFVHAYSKLCKN